VFTVISISIPAKITGSSNAFELRLACLFSLNHAVAAGTHPIVVHIEAAVDSVDEDEELPLAPWH
jgi:hypothetical protein